jgi:hypothetical protein
MAGSTRALLPNAQQAAVRRNPNLLPMYRGWVIDMAAKRSVAKEWLATRGRRHRKW